MATYTPIQSIVLTSNQNSITFSNISQAYEDLVVVFYGSTSTQNDVGVYINNNSSSIYSGTRLYGNGSTPASDRGTGQTYHAITIGGPGSPGQSIVHFMSYSNPNIFKSCLSLASNPLTTGYVGGISQLWRNTEAIHTLQFFASGSTLFGIGTSIDLYGISGGSPKAYGGDYVYQSSGYWIHEFWNSGLFTPVEELAGVDYLVVAGGGGGNIGGGGAGGVRSTVTASGGTAGLGTALTLTPTNHVVTVGAGGRRGGYTTSHLYATSGSDSVFSSITSLGGGRGAGGASDKENGGSGGGGSASYITAGTGQSNQGFNGGNGAANVNMGCGGGGGGAGAAGTNAVANGAAGNGGNGVAVAITGSSVTYGGGGGGGRGDTSPGGSGGTGGGGTGDYISGGSDGTARTGGGGGGSGTTKYAYNGGSGIVIVRYPV
jgi:hypothetical protein